MTIAKAIFRQEALGAQQRRVSSKKSVQQGRSPFLRAERTGTT